MLLKMEEFSLLQVKTQNRVQRKGTRESTNSSYHINHSSKVVHLKWGVKRSLILPRSSCFKTKNTIYSPPLRMCGHRLVAWDQWIPEAGREVSGGLDTHIPGTRDSDPRHSAPQPREASSQDSAMSRGGDIPHPTPTWNPGAGKQVPQAWSLRGRSGDPMDQGANNQSKMPPAISHPPHPKPALGQGDKNLCAENQFTKSQLAKRPIS